MWAKIMIKSMVKLVINSTINTEMLLRITFIFTSFRLPDT